MRFTLLRLLLQSCRLPTPEIRPNKAESFYLTISDSFTSKQGTMSVQSEHVFCVEW